MSTRTRPAGLAITGTALHLGGALHRRLTVARPTLQWTPGGGTPTARCDVCARAKKGRCGTATAPYRCRRRPALGLPTSPRGARAADSGSDGEGGGGGDAPQQLGSPGGASIAPVEHLHPAAELAAATGKWQAHVAWRLALV
jgi:hypothetical protein